MEHYIVNNETYSLKRKMEEDTEEPHSSKRFHFDKEPFKNTTEDVIMYDPFTDEDESLDESLFTDYVEEDADYTEALERGWSDLFNDDLHWDGNMN